jgi:hypothetical protein
MAYGKVTTEPRVLSAAGLVPKTLHQGLNIPNPKEDISNNI